MEDRLLHNILELQDRLKRVEMKLDIAMEGLKVISDGQDTYQVAYKTISEINSI